MGERTGERIGERMEEPIRLERVEPQDADLAGLIEQLDRDLQEVYKPEDIFDVDLADPAETAGIRFLVAYLGGTPVGCGAIRPLDPGVAELKRFYVARAYRQRGIASRLLRELEAEARAAGCSTLRLETGEKLVEAVGLYRKFGFYEIERYGEYVNCAESYCMEKRLD